MRISVPYVGHLWVALRALAARSGLELVEPPRPSQHTVSLGVRHSPEWMCFPFKVVLGSFIEAIERGADTIVMAEGPQLCRLGYYARLHEQILHDLGYTHVRVLTFNWQEEQILGFARFLRSILGKERPWKEIVGHLKHGLEQLVLMEDVEKRVHYLRPRARDWREVNLIWQVAGPRISAALTGQELREVRRQLLAELEAVDLDPRADPLKVGFLGEFILVIDPFFNLDLEDELGRRGVEIVRSSWIAGWAKIWLFMEMLGLSHGQEIKKAARPYLKRDVSGEGLQTIGETVLHAQEGFHGIIHIQPFTCLPEIMAQNILPQVLRDHDIPVLEIIIDEQTAKTGIITRLEAFVDLMQRRRIREALAARRNS